MTRATTRNHGTVRFLVFLVIALVAMMPTGAFAQSIPGLVAAWGFNEGVGTTAADASGNNNTGVISGATWSTQGRFGNALNFDGTNDVVVVANSPSLNLTTAMTLSAGGCGGGPGGGGGRFWRGKWTRFS